MWIRNSTVNIFWNDIKYGKQLGKMFIFTVSKGHPGGNIFTYIVMFLKTQHTSDKVYSEA